MIKVKVDVTKLDTSAFFKGAKGTYVDLVLWENRGGKDQYGNDFAVKQDMPKERRGEKTPIVGSAKFVGTVQPSRPAPESDSGPVKTFMKEKPAQTSAPADDSQDVPF